MNLKYLNSVLINLIIVSIIPFLIWGPFFPDLIVSISALFFLFYVFKNKEFYFFNNKPLIIFFIFCIYCILLSIFVAEDIKLSFESSLFYFRIGVFSCFIWYLIDKDKSILTFFYYSLVLCFSALVIDGYIQYFTGKNILGITHWENYRISSFFGDELIMGSYVSRLYPLLFALFLIKKKRLFEIYFVSLLFILASVLILMSGERTALFFHVISLLFIFILINRFVKLKIILAFFIIVFLSILISTNEKLQHRFIDDPISHMQIFKKNQKTFIFTPHHDSLIRTSFNIFKDQPIYGHGPKMFRLLCKDPKYRFGINPCSTHPHNFYIQLLAETGIIGFLFLFSALSYVIYTSLRQFKSIIFRQKRPLSDYQVCLLAGILITVWPLTPNGNFFNNWLMVVYSLPIGFYLQSIYSKKAIK
ncbi:O-antigen ligase family protein [Candidatus Pelagibacter sp. HIMB1623]|uniref:O-antigen ligase family protein n=1 Tax=Candidatus Pelagibacter sp. HIMB1623 TaxID=3413358 RepID=UPI003F84EA6C